MRGCSLLLCALPWLGCLETGTQRAPAAVEEAHHAVVGGPLPEAVFAELWWDCEGYQVGADLDLHLRHPFATGWFDPEYDCHFGNKLPGWGARLEVENALHGPEIMRLSQPGEGLCFRVGVHYYGDFGYGSCRASVEIRVDEEVALSWSDVWLDRDDVWEVATVCWPSAAVVVLQEGAGVPKVLAGVRPPTER